jgi:hypothetical protein
VTRGQFEAAVAAAPYCHPKAVIVANANADRPTGVLALPSREPPTMDAEPPPEPIPLDWPLAAEANLEPKPLVEPALEPRLAPQPEPARRSGRYGFVRVSPECPR